MIERRGKRRRVDIDDGVDTELRADRTINLDDLLHHRQRPAAKECVQCGTIGRRRQELIGDERLDVAVGEPRRRPIGLTGGRQRGIDRYDDVGRRVRGAR